MARQQVLQVVRRAHSVQKWQKSRVQIQACVAQAWISTIFQQQFEHLELDEFLDLVVTLALAGRVKMRKFILIGVIHIEPVVYTLKILRTSTAPT